MSAPGGGLTVLHLDTERGWRGGERQAFWLARALARLGHRSLVAARAGEPLARRAAEAGLDVVPCDPFTEADPIAAFRLRRAIRREGVDLVHAHTGHAVGLGALATLATSTPMVLTRRVDFRLRDNAASRWKYSRASAVIAISRAVRTALVSSGLPEEEIEIIPSGVDLEREIRPAPPATLRELGIGAGAPLVVMVAALVDHKDPATFVGAIDIARKHVPALRALLIGEGPLRSVIEEQIARSRLAPALQLTGYRGDADALIAAADVFVLSSKEEGLGTVLLDALAAGVPIAATRGGGIPEIVEHGRSGLLAEPQDPRALGEAIARILTDERLRATLKEGGAERVRAFSVEETARRTLEVYRRVLAAR